jgi:MinD superfamily P-loop ATPase
MIISVASGKGGTGKTLIASSLALSIDRNVQLIDCDVEEPNAHIFLKPIIRESRKVNIPVPKIDPKKCDYCGKCQQVCAYNAIAVLPPVDSKRGQTLVFDNLCHGCGSCSYFCPREAIVEVPKEIGVMETGLSGDIHFVHARMNIGEAMAPPLIREELKQIRSGLTVIIDAPPGTSCPVVESVKESDFCILVTEPTPFGLNDLVLSVEVLRKLSIPFGIVINRSDLGDTKTDAFCKREKIPILMKIPFRREIAEAYSKGIPLVQAFPEYKKDFEMLLTRCRLNINSSSDREKSLD